MKRTPLNRRQKLEPATDEASQLAFPKPVRAKKPRKPLRAKPRPPGTPQRNDYMKRKPAKRAATTDYARMARVRELPCCAPADLRYPCGPWHQDDETGRWKLVMQANHAGRKPGMALKADDDTTIPMCLLHHGQYTDGNGVFKGWTKSGRQAWREEKISETRAALGMVAA